MPSSMWRVHVVITSVFFVCWEFRVLDAHCPFVIQCVHVVMTYGVAEGAEKYPLSLRKHENSQVTCGELGETAAE